MGNGVREGELLGRCLIRFYAATADAVYRKVTDGWPTNRPEPATSEPVVMHTPEKLASDRIPRCRADN